MTRYGYSINLNERGSFYADVRDASGNTVWELHNDEDGTIWTIEDGYMKHVNDLDGLKSYMITVLGYPADIDLLPLVEFERKLDEDAEQEDA